MKHDLTHARHDPAHCLTPGLFRSVKRGDRKAGLDVCHEYGDGHRIEFRGPEQLGADDLRILQGLVAMAGPLGIVLSPEPKTDTGKQLRLFLEAKWDALHHDALIVQGSYGALAREVGYADINSTRPIRECIERLFSVRIFEQKGSRRQGTQLLSEYASDEGTGRLYVALNPRISQAVLGHARHTRISMDEVRALKGDVARLIHQRLCAWINAGRRQRVSIETLSGYAWPSEATLEATTRKRKQRMRLALEELRSLGWRVTEYVRGKFEIERPASGDASTLANNASEVGIPCSTVTLPGSTVTEARPIGHGRNSANVVSARG